MANLWDDIAKTIKESVDTIVEKTEQLSKIGKIKVDIINIKRNVEKNFTELGGKVYHIIVEEKKTQVATDKKVKEILKSVKQLENDLQEKNRQLEKVKAGQEKSAKPSKTDAKKTTPKPTTKRTNASAPPKSTRAASSAKRTTTKAKANKSKPKAS